MIYAGCAMAALAAFTGLVVLPGMQANTPAGPDGLNTMPADPVAAGRAIYVNYGCANCHSQQLRSCDLRPATDRGWGQRRTTTTDLAQQHPILLGTSRTGPDLSDVATRQPSAAWHYLHLYDPQAVAPHSIMPPHPFLFADCKADEMPPLDAFEVPDGSNPRQLMPMDDARALVAYLLNLRQHAGTVEVAP